MEFIMRIAFTPSQSRKIIRWTILSRRPSVVKYLNHSYHGLIMPNSILLLFSKKQIDTGSVKIILSMWGQDGEVRNQALLSSFY